MKIKNILLVISPIIMIIVVFNIFFQFLNPEEYLERYVKPQTYSFVVLEKYLDEKQFPKFKLKRNEKIAIYNAHDWVNLYDSVQVLDSIVKPKYLKKIMVYRKDEKISEHSYNFGTDTRMVRKF